MVEAINARWHLSCGMKLHGLRDGLVARQAGPCSTQWRPHRDATVQRCPQRLRCAAAQATLDEAAAATPAAPPTAAVRLGADIPVQLRHVRVGSKHDFLMLLPDLEAVMDMYIAAGQADRDPYWCEPWPSALAMAEEVLRRPGLVTGRRVAELGCGLGLAGLAAAAAGAAHVVLLDREPLALQCALLNAALNGLHVPGLLPCAAQAGTDAADAVQAGQGRALEAGEVTLDLAVVLQHLPAEVQTLVQEQRAALAHRLASHAGTGPGPSSAAAAGAGGGTVSAAVFDWSAPVELAPADDLLVCDCLYETFSVAPVAGVAPALLRRGADARLLLADPPNRARHNRERFLELLTGEGTVTAHSFVVEESEEKRVQVWEEGKQAWREVPIAWLALRRAAGGDTVGLKWR